jgi:hypothetical protein
MKKCFLLLTVLSLSPLFSASNPTADYWQCEHKIGGSWDYGRVPNACDVAPFGDSDYVKSTFSPLIFDDAKVRSEEKKRYIDNLVPLIRDASSYYLESRNPDATQDEKEAWGDAVLAVAHQESFMTHYRIADDTRLKMIRGDAGHGHGMMQIDDRWHFTQINEGKGWQIFENVTYALEIFYDAWERAQSASCVDSLYERSRSAYSIYNGGASKACRWTNPNDTWAQNDTNYKNKLDVKEWESWVDDLSAPSVLAVGCFMEGNTQCAPESPADNIAQYSDKLLALDSGEYCLFENEHFSCVEEQIDALCLSKKLSKPLTDTLLTLNKTQSSAYPIVKYSREICQEEIANLASIGGAVRAKKAITLRETPGGTALGSVVNGTVYQVLDFEVRNSAPAYRYYKVRAGELTGYIYAGKESDATQWSENVAHSELDNVNIAQASDSVIISASSGINQRRVIGGEIITLIPSGSSVSVVQTIVQGSGRSIYYKVLYEGALGYIYGGQFLPEETLQNWVRFSEKGELSLKKGTLDSKVPWGYLHSCAASSCTKVANVVGAKMQSYCENRSCSYEMQNLILLEESGDWSKVSLEKSNQSGWIQSSQVEWQE